MGLADLVERGDVDELTRAVDALCQRRAWDDLVGLRDRCRAALERGKQLWAVAAHAEYRLALEAPGEWAGAVVVPGAGRFALGPLPEVAASTHEWAELRTHIPRGPLHAVAAHERVVRGEDLTGDDAVDPTVLDVPLRLAEWEPAYAIATYRPDGADFPTPSPLALGGSGEALPPPGADAGDRTAIAALTALAEPWVTGSNGRADAVAVTGNAAAAVAALGVRRARLVEVDAATALAWIGWAGASGGAHGRRRGAAAGRFATWWALAALGGLLDDWPVDPDELGELAGELRWVLWDAGEPATGWTLRLAVEDPPEGLAWALVAVDAV